MTALAPVPHGRPRRLVYLGTPAMSVAPLRELVAAGFDVGLVVTGPDRRRGRGGAMSPSPVKQAAIELGIPVGHDVDDVLGVGADLGVVVAFGQLVRRRVLEQLPMVNLHFSLLPRWRGAAPVERAYLSGDDVTGVCLMQLEEGLDTGPVFARAEVPIDRSSGASALRGALVEAGTSLLLAELTSGLGEAEPQTGPPTYAAKISADELRLEWSRPADELARVVGLGAAWTTFRGQRLKVLVAEPVPDAATDVPGTLAVGISAAGAVATGEGMLRLLSVQPAGRPSMAFAEWANGARLAADERLGA